MNYLTYCTLFLGALATGLLFIYCFYQCYLKAREAYACYCHSLRRQYASAAVADQRDIFISVIAMVFCAAEIAFNSWLIYLLIADNGIKI